MNATMNDFLCRQTRKDTNTTTAVATTNNNGHTYTTRAEIKKERKNRSTEFNVEQELCRIDE